MKANFIYKAHFEWFCNAMCFTIRNLKVDYVWCANRQPSAFTKCIYKKKTSCMKYHNLLMFIIKSII